MKKKLLLFLVVLPFFSFSQAVDRSSVASRVDSLLELSREYSGDSKFDSALARIEAAEELTLEKLGRESAAFGSVCFHRGYLHDRKGEYKDAEKWYLEALAIQEKHFGRIHPDYASSVHNLARVYLEMGDYEKTEPLSREAVALREEIYGKEHPDYARSLINLGNLFLHRNDPEKAEPLLFEARAIMEKTLGKEHPDYAFCLHNLAVIYWQLGNYEAAEPFILEAVALRKKTLGDTHPFYAYSLVNLAILYGSMGEYEKAGLLSLESLSIFEKTIGKEHPDYAMALNRLATHYRDLGIYEKAETLYREAAAICEKPGNKENIRCANVLNNLGALYFLTEEYEKAEPLYREALAVVEKIVGKEHPEYANGLDNLANLYMYMEEYSKAEALFLEALALNKKVQGEEHPGYGRSLNNLALFYKRVGRTKEAEQLLSEAIAVKEKTLSETNPDYENSLVILGGMYFEMRDNGKAQPLLLKANEIGKALLERAARHLSESELAEYIHSFNNRQDLFFSFIENRPELSGAAFDNALFYKGFLLNSARQVSKLAQADSTTAQMFYRLKSCYRRLAREYSRPLAGQDEVAELEEKANRLEKELARTVAGFGDALRQVGWREVQKQLQAGEAAVEFVHYDHYSKETSDRTLYAALVLRPGDERPYFISLFEETAFGKLLAQEEVPGKNFLAQAYSRGITPKKKGQGPGLFELAWQPLDSLLAGIHTVYFSPSGRLHRVNFGAIPVGKDSVLADKYGLVRLGSTRSLVLPSVTHSNTPPKALLFGGIQYELDTASMQQDTALLTLLPANAETLSFKYAARGPDRRLNNWNFLPGTKAEVANIDTLLRKAGYVSEIRSGTTASEGAFKAIGRLGGPAPRVLHLATHGYFFPNPDSPGGGLADNSSSLGAGWEEASTFMISDHPMIRSGLILAGGNYAWQTGQPFRPDMEDGILTAFEISQLDLSDTELVVLSACETGLGDIRGNEGVYGLQRAFKFAGAKYVLMSLWQVPDFQTQELMTAFYYNWLEEGMDIPAAFRNAQAELRRKYPSPFLWAGFVLNR